MRRVAEQFCLRSVTQLIPDLSALAFEEILELRRHCGVSLEAYGQRARSLAEDFLLISDERVDTSFAQHAAVSMAGDYNDLVEAVESSGLLTVARERRPIIAGAGLALTSSFVLGASTGNIVVAAAGFGGGVAGQLLTNVLEAVRRRRRLKAHYLYWRYQLTERASA